MGQGSLVAQDLPSPAAQVPSTLVLTLPLMFDGEEGQDDPNKEVVCNLVLVEEKGETSALGSHGQLKPQKKWWRMPKLNLCGAAATHRMLQPWPPQQLHLLL